MPALVTEQSLGHMLKEARIRRGMTQHEAGTRIGVQQAMISKIESGRLALRVEMLFKLLAALDYEMLIQPREEGVIAVTGDAW